jgi:hypothetical protein
MWRWALVYSKIVLIDQQIFHELFQMSNWTEANPLTTSKTIISNLHGNIVECVDAYVGTKQWAITKM